MPKLYTVNSSADSILRRSLASAIARCVHACGTSPLPAIGFVMKMLTYHDCASDGDDDSEFMVYLIEVWDHMLYTGTMTRLNWFLMCMVCRRDCVRQRSHALPLLDSMTHRCYSLTKKHVPLLVCAGFTSLYHH